MTDHESIEERVAREDLVMFINACFACTGQREFYGDASGQRVAINFLHRYILGNYRLLYARTLSTGVNHFNQSQIILNLLATGRQTIREERHEENSLITTALSRLPPQRVYRLFESLRNRGVNNRRTRAVIKAFVARRHDVTFDAVKYRRRVRIAAAHAHLSLDHEVGDFLFGGNKRQTFRSELLETYRQAHFAKEAVYRLPFTVAEGLAAKHKIPRREFLEGIAKQMTTVEKLRLQTSAADQNVDLALDLGRAPLTRLAMYLTSLTRTERRERSSEFAEALENAANRTYRQRPYPLGKVAAVLDRSYSSSGTSEKRRRPLAVALATSYVLRQAASDYRAFWTPTLDEEEDFFATPYGQTDLAGPLLRALKWAPDLIVIVSDGYENSPPGAVNQLIKAFRSRVRNAKDCSIIHLNPVFDSEHFAPKGLGSELPTVGIRDAADSLTMLGFARFAEGAAPLEELEAYLEGSVRRFLGGGSGA